MWYYVNCSPDGSSATTQSPITEVPAASTGPSVAATGEQPSSLGITCIAMSTVAWVLHTLEVTSSNLTLVFVMYVFFPFFSFFLCVFIVCS